MLSIKEKDMAETGKGCGCSCGGGACGPSRTAAGVMKTDSIIRAADRLGVLRVRLGIRRDGYQTAPGLYALGHPGPRSDVFVSANYKLSFDVLRKALAGRDAWILVLDTRGVNVWCAAGKGTFGTAELIAKIGETGLADLVETRALVVPQLGAPGVAGHEVERATGFKVVWGPVRAADIKAFLANGKKTDPDMRRVRFNLADRAKLVFVEFVGVLKYILIGAVLLGALAFVVNGFSFSRAFIPWMLNVLAVIVALAAGTVFTPLALPWLPGRSFAFKGLVMGVLAGLGYALLVGRGPLEAAAWTALSAAGGSFFAMFFTGASTYTNLSGTVKEMRRYIPVQIGAAAAGALLFIVPAIAAAVR
jgi:hypothetical protein